jgi:YfiH family protein
MIANCKNGVEYYRFDNLAGRKCLNHGIFTRRGGCSEAPFESLNVGLGLGDSERNVSGNRRLIDECMQSRCSSYLRQVHGKRVVLKARGCQPPLPGIPESPPVGDAMISDAPGCYLVIQVADCQPILFFDPYRRVVAAAHCGWRGSLQNIIGATVHAMVSEFNCAPDQIRVGIGPSLGPCCAEFVNYRSEFPPPLWKYKRENDHFDLWRLSVDQLRQAGVPSENVEFSKLCTRCRSDLFFSYRAEGATGRFAAVIGLREPSE